MIGVFVLGSMAGCGKQKVEDKKMGKEVEKSMKLEEEEKEKHPVVLRLEGGDWGFPNPFKHYPRGPGGFKTELVYDSLLEKNEEKEIPWLAKEYTISEDGKEYIFTLRENAKWHDGTPFTAEDVKFTFDYYRDHPPVWNNLLIDGNYIVEKAEILNENKVKLIVDEKNTTYLSKIGAVRIIPKHIWEKVEDPTQYEGDGMGVGCGPFVLENYSSEHGSYQFKAFGDYWGPKQKVDGIEYIPVSDSILAFENGDIDFLTATPDIVSRYENNSEYKLTQNKPFFGYRLIFNMEKRPELKEVVLRKAIAYGLDRQEMVEKVARGSGIVASMAYLPVEHGWYNEAITQYTYEPEKAKELLQGKKYQFELLTGNSSQEVKIAELMKISLEKVGVQVQIKSVDMKTRDSAVKAGNYEWVITRHGGWGKDPDSLREHYGITTLKGAGSPASGGIPGYFNQEINDLCWKQMVQMNPEERRETIFKIQELVAEEVPMIPLFNTIDIFVTRPQKFDGWMFRYDHNYMDACKLSYVEREVEE